MAINILSVSFISTHLRVHPKVHQLLPIILLCDAGVVEIPKARFLKRERISFSIQSAGVWRGSCVAKSSIYDTVCRHVESRITMTVDSN